MLDCSATIDKRVAEVPRGRYMPVSHSLIVCWRVPSLSDNSRWVIPRWRRSAWIRWLFHCSRLICGCLLMLKFYTIQCKPSKSVSGSVEYAGYVISKLIGIFNYFLENMADFFSR